MTMGNIASGEVVGSPALVQGPPPTVVGIPAIEKGLSHVDGEVAAQSPDPATCKMPGKPVEGSKEPELTDKAVEQIMAMSFKAGGPIEKLTARLFGALKERKLFDGVAPVTQLEIMESAVDQIYAVFGAVVRDVTNLSRAMRFADQQALLHSLIGWEQRHRGQKPDEKPEDKKESKPNE